MDKQKRYQRLYAQLNDLLSKTEDPIARMATITAVLHHKMRGFFWTGFYIIRNGELIVGPYQGPLACQVLKKDKGVCWSAINRKETVLVQDVSKFPDHITCDSRSKSEIVVPVKDIKGKIFAVLDIDSTSPGHFDMTDAEHLERITSLVTT